MKNQALFVLWHVFVIGLIAVAYIMGWAEPLLHSGREIPIAVMGALYALGVLLSALRMRQFMCSNRWKDAAHDLGGIALVGKLLVYAGLLGTVAGIIVGTNGVSGDSVANAAAAGAMVGTLIGGLGLTFTATFVGIALNVAIIVGSRFVQNLAHCRAQQFAAELKATRR